MFLYVSSKLNFSADPGDNLTLCKFLLSVWQTLASVHSRLIMSPNFLLNSTYLGVEYKQRNSSLLLRKYGLVIKTLLSVLEIMHLIVRSSANLLICKSLLLPMLQFPGCKFRVYSYLCCN